MITLLRRFRQRLLSEHKFSKYLLYAIGEIVLVVIGILIALQINNWNTSKKESAELNDYLLKISENISEDLIVAEANLDRRNRVADLSKKIIKYLVNDQIDSLALPNTVAIFVDFQFTSRKGGFQSLTNSGYIGKIKRSRIDSLLFQYYYNVDDLIREETSFNGYMEAMEASSNATVPILPMAKQYYGYVTDSLELSKANSDYFANVAVQNAIIRSSGQTQMVSKYESLIATGRLLHKEIQNFIKHSDD